MVNTAALEKGLQASAPRHDEFIREKRSMDNPHHVSNLQMLANKKGRPWRKRRPQGK
jgi:hypothetical protein